MRYRRRPRVRAVAWSLAGFTLLELAATVGLIVLNAGRVGAGRAISEVILAVAAGLYAGAGLLITRRFPANAVGWLLSVIGLSLAAALLTEQYALYGLATARGSLPGAGLVGWGAGILAYLTVLLLFCLFLLFPDGRLPSPAWRPVLWAVFVVMAGAAAQTLQAGTKIGGLTGALPAAHVSYPNPLGIFPRHGWFSGLVAVIYVLAVLTAALSVASVFARRRRASPELRKQLAWLGYVGLMTAMWVVALLIYGLATHFANGPLGTIIWAFIVITPVAGIPLACAVAVLKYRLYEIDRIISRTLAYAIVTGLLVGVYAGLVLLTTQVFRVHAPVAVAASTLAAAGIRTAVFARVRAFFFCAPFFLDFGLSIVGFSTFGIESSCLAATIRPNPTTMTTIKTLMNHHGGVDRNTGARTTARIVALTVTVAIPRLDF